MTKRSLSEISGGGAGSGAGALDQIECLGVENNRTDPALHDAR
jgi:hypothetical protein